MAAHYEVKESGIVGIRSAVAERRMTAVAVAEEFYARIKKDDAEIGAFLTLSEDRAFAQAARANVHVKLMYGRSSHHQVESIFKAFARALRFAITRDRQLQRLLPSTKGML